jgi:hypothetical protein
MAYKQRKSKDSQILVGLSNLSLSDRWKRLQDLTVKLQKGETSLEKKQSGKTERTKKREREILADEDGLIELRYRLQLEKTEYLALKKITPDHEEPAEAR